MKILLVHNYYGSDSPSGENMVFDIEKDLLLSRGHHVQEFTAYSDDIRNKGVSGLITGALVTPWNVKSALKIKSVMVDFKPDVVHVHNTFPLISPSIFHVIHKYAATVFTLHNYRIFCPAGIPLRNGITCTECLDLKSVFPAMKYGCYRSSHIATLPLAVSVWLHRVIKTWSKNVDAFISLTEFQRDVLFRSGLEKTKLHIKPNFFPGNPSVFLWNQRPLYVVFVGRLGREKGLVTLINAWRKWGANAPELRIIGSGELRSVLESMSKGLPVRFLGQLSNDETLEQIAKSRLLILPSECYEGFPMVVREAFALGTPVAVSNLGPLPYIVQHNINGVIFPAANTGQLFEIVKNTWEDRELISRLSDGARQTYMDKYNESQNYSILMSIYNDALLASKRRGII